MKNIGIVFLIVGVIILSMAAFCMDYNPKDDNGPDIPTTIGEEAKSDIKEIMKNDKHERIEGARIAMYIVSCSLVAVGGILTAAGIIKEKKHPKAIVYTCVKCGAEADEEQEFCPKCNSRMFYRCHNCHEIYDEEIDFCSKCGTRIK